MMARNGHDGSTPFSRWLRGQPIHDPAPVPVESNPAGTEYACMSHDHHSVPYYYRRKNGSQCDCGRNN